MASWIKLLLPAVPVLIEAAREARRVRLPAPARPAVQGGVDGLERAVTRVAGTLDDLSAEVGRLKATQAVLERRLDVLNVVTWSVAGVLSVVVIGLIVRLAAG